MEIDRAEVRRVLQLLAEERRTGDPGGVESSTDRDTHNTLLYLLDLGLIEGNPVGLIDHGTRVYGVRITARGLDYLVPDGGLTAELSVVTVRLDAATLMAILEAKIAASSEPEEVKSKMRHCLRSLTSEGWKALTTKLVEKGLDSLAGEDGPLSRLLGLWS